MSATKLRIRWHPIIAAILLISAAAFAQVNILGYWWENPLPFQETPKGLGSLRAQDCGLCHQEIYREWKQSTHSHALSDLQFQEEMKKEPETNWLCLNCHTPLANQLDTIAVGVRNRSTHQPVTRKNARFDAALRDEGVTCAVCHVRDGVILGPYGDSRAPHPVRRDPKLLTVDLCSACHQATASYTDVLVCTFDTAEEWRSSPYAAKGQPCSGCHMPAINRPAAAGAAPRPGRRHYFAGSLIAKTIGQARGLPANPDNLFRSGLSVEFAGATRRASSWEAALKLKNAYAGHKLPTGDPERVIRIDVRLLSGKRTIGAQSLRLGQKWEWYPKARKLADNRLAPFEERTEKLQFPAGRLRPDKLDVTVTNIRMNEEAARFHRLIGRYPIEAKVNRFQFPIP